MNNNKIILDLCGGTGAWSKPYKDAGYDVKLITSPVFDIRKFYTTGGNATKCEYHNHDDSLCFPYELEYRPDKNTEVSVIEKTEVYGILAAPPCTMFSFARTNAKKLRDFNEGMECIRSCLDVIWSSMEIKQETRLKTLPLKFWALENPYFGFLKNFLGKPAFIFDPWEFGDGYQKRTALWGNFNEPIKNPVPTTDKMKKLAKTNSYLHTMGNLTNRGKPPSIWAKKDLLKFDMLASKDIHSESELDGQARRAITPVGFAKAFFQANQ